jgi:ABC-type molybdate transport system permease subunit
MNINVGTSSTINLESNFSDNYPLSGSNIESNSFSFALTGVMIATTIMTSASTVLPPENISSGSAVSLEKFHTYRIKHSSQTAIATFTTELQRRSQSLSTADSQLFRKVILSKVKPGIPSF